MNGQLEEGSSSSGSSSCSSSDSGSSTQSQNQAEKFIRENQQIIALITKWEKDDVKWCPYPLLITDDDVQIAGPLVDNPLERLQSVRNIRVEVHNDRMTFVLTDDVGNDIDGLMSLDVINLGKGAYGSAYMAIERTSRDTIEFVIKVQVLVEPDTLEIVMQPALQSTRDQAVFTASAGVMESLFYYTILKETLDDTHPDRAEAANYILDHIPRVYGTAVVSHYSRTKGSQVVQLVTFQEYIRGHYVHVNSEYQTIYYTPRKTAEFLDEMSIFTRLLDTLGIQNYDMGYGNVLVREGSTKDYMFIDFGVMRIQNNRILASSDVTGMNLQTLREEYKNAVTLITEPMGSVWPYYRGMGGIYGEYILFHIAAGMVINKLTNYGNYKVLVDERSRTRGEGGEARVFQIESFPPGSPEAAIYYPCIKCGNFSIWTMKVLKTYGTRHTFALKSYRSPSFANQDVIERYRVGICQTGSVVVDKAAKSHKCVAITGDFLPFNVFGLIENLMPVGIKSDMALLKSNRVYSTLNDEACREIWTCLFHVFLNTGASRKPSESFTESYVEGATSCLFHANDNRQFDTQVSRMMESIRPGSLILIVVSNVVDSALRPQKLYAPEHGEDDYVEMDQKRNVLVPRFEKPMYQDERQYDDGSKKRSGRSMHIFKDDEFIYSEVHNDTPFARNLCTVEKNLESKFLLLDPRYVEYAGGWSTIFFPIHTREDMPQVIVKGIFIEFRITEQFRRHFLGS